MAALVFGPYALSFLRLFSSAVESMERRLRLRAEADFARVRAQGRSWRDRLFTLIVLPNDQPYNRYGFVVSKRVGNAVTRNLVKRRLREILRHLDRAGQVRSGHDCLLIVRPIAVESPFAALGVSIEALLSRARLLQPAIHAPVTPPETP